MGTVESQPEPLIDHLRGALSQLQGHRWTQFHLSDSTPPRPHLRADSQGGRISIWRSLLLEPFYEPRTRVSSLFHYSFVNAIISLVLYLYTYLPYNLYTCLPYTPKPTNQKKKKNRPFNPNYEKDMKCMYTFICIHANHQEGVPQEIKSNPVAKACTLE